jgi:hypothetical protein
MRDGDFERSEAGWGGTRWEHPGRFLTSPWSHPPGACADLQAGIEGGEEEVQGIVTTTRPRGLEAVARPIRARAAAKAPV